MWEERKAGFRTWEEYKRGFGFHGGDYWLGKDV